MSPLNSHEACRMILKSRYLGFNCIELWYFFAPFPFPTLFYIFSLHTPTFSSSFLTFFFVYPLPIQLKSQFVNRPCSFFSSFSSSNNHKNWFELSLLKQTSPFFTKTFGTTGFSLFFLIFVGSHEIKIFDLGASTYKSFLSNKKNENKVGIHGESIVFSLGNISIRFF